MTKPWTVKKKLNATQCKQMQWEKKLMRMCQKKLPPSLHVQTQLSTTSPPAKYSESLLLFLVSTPTAVLHDGGPAWSSRPPVQRVSQPVAGWGRCLGGVDSYPGFLGSLSRDEPPPFSLRTSFSLLRRIDARSLLKDPLLFREPEPSWWDTSQSHSYTPLSNIFRRVQTQNVD